jgi:hypothetical protein
MLMMMPIALLFILTPINLRVASFALGLFVFVALWGVIDAGIYQLTLGRAMDVLAELRATNVAAHSWILAPSAAMKALAIFGSFRTAAAGLAGAFVFTVFRFSGNMFTALPQACSAYRVRAAWRRRRWAPARVMPRRSKRRLRLAAPRRGVRLRQGLAILANAAALALTGLSAPPAR